MSAYTFTPCEGGDPELTARYQAALAKLKPACSRCGHNLAAKELASGKCADHELCRIRRAGGKTTGYVALRTYVRKHGTPFVSSAWGKPKSEEPPRSIPEVLLDAELEGAPVDWAKREIRRPWREESPNSYVGMFAAQFAEVTRP